MALSIRVRPKFAPLNIAVAPNYERNISWLAIRIFRILCLPIKWIIDAVFDQGCICRHGRLHCRKRSRRRRLVISCTLPVDLGFKSVSFDRALAQFALYSSIGSDLGPSIVNFEISAFIVLSSSRSSRSLLLARRRNSERFCASASIILPFRCRITGVTTRSRDLVHSPGNIHKESSVPVRTLELREICRSF